MGDNCNDIAMIALSQVSLSVLFEITKISVVILIAITQHSVGNTTDGSRQNNIYRKKTASAVKILAA